VTIKSRYSAIVTTSVDQWEIQKYDILYNTLNTVNVLYISAY